VKNGTKNIVVELTLALGPEANDELLNSIPGAITVTGMKAAIIVATLLTATEENSKVGERKE
jgi:hypothetical protein